MVKSVIVLEHGVFFNWGSNEVSGFFWTIKYSEKLLFYLTDLVYVWAG